MVRFLLPAIKFKYQVAILQSAQRPWALPQGTRESMVTTP